MAERAIPKKRYSMVSILVSFLLFAACALPLRSSIVDDTYIHLQYARNLAEAGELSFNRGDPTYGATSPLWIFLLAAVHRLGGNLLIWCRVLAWFFALAAVALLHRLTIRVTGSEAAAFAAAVILAAEAWLLRWTAVGMETPLAAFVVLAAVSSSFSAGRSAARSALFGLLLFLAVLSRPEAMLLVPFALVVFARAGGPSRERFAWLAVFIVCFAVWLLAVKHHTGTYLPLTAGAKQGRPVLSAAVFTRAVVPIKIMALTLALPWLSIAAVLAVGLVTRRSPLHLFAGEGAEGDQHRRTGLLLALLWSVALPVVYVLFDFQVLSRYLVPLFPTVVLLGVAGAKELFARIVRRPGARTIALALFTVVTVVQSVVFYFVIVVKPTRAFARGIEEVLVPMGEWLARNTDESAVVALPDIGAVGYTSHRRVLDLGGLVTPEINRMRRTIDVERIIEEGLYLEFDPDFLIDRSREPARFDGRSIRGVRFTEIMRGTVANLGIRQPDPVVYALYRIERRGEGGE